MGTLSKRIGLGRLMETVTYVASVVTLVLGFTVFTGGTAYADPVPGSITNEANGLCLNVASATPVAHTRVIQSTCSSSNVNQHWTVEYYTSDNTYVRLHSGYNHSLCVQAISAVNNSALELATCTGGFSKQYWGLYATSFTNYYALVSQFCMLSYDSNNGSAIGQTQYCNYTSGRQAWGFW